MLLLVVLASARGSFRAACLPPGNWGSSTTSTRMLTTKEMDRNLIPPGDAAHRNGTNNGGSRASDNDGMEWDNAGPGDGGPASMIVNNVKRTW